MNVHSPLHLTGPSAVFIDWANVYGWTKYLKNEVDAKKLLNHLKTYPQIKAINFYYGTDDHPKSKAFLGKVKRLGYQVTTKPVKYITVHHHPLIHKRKCDFDVEITMDVYAALEAKIDSFIFISGDGDFAPLYHPLIKRKKQVIVVYSPKHIGREIWEIPHGIYKLNIKKIPSIRLKTLSPRPKTRGAINKHPTRSPQKSQANTKKITPKKLHPLNKNEIKKLLLKFKIYYHL